MKTGNYNILLPFIMVVVFSACKKEGENVFNMFDDVTVTLHNNSPYSITGYKEVNDGDSVYIDFTVKSEKKDMHEVWLLENGQTSPAKKIPIDDESKRREFSYTIKLKADQRVGQTSYRVFPVDEDLVYMGDGHKQVTIDVKPNFTFLTERYAYFPDSAKTNKCYFSLYTGESFNYEQGAANASKIDVGVDTIYRATDPKKPTVLTQFGVLYSLDANAASLPVYSFYDISTWNKRSTLFSSAADDKGAFNKLKAGSQILAAALKAKPDKKGPIEFKGGQIIYFKTQEGRYGVLYATAITASYRQGGSYMEYQVKVLD